MYIKSRRRAAATWSPAMPPCQQQHAAVDGDSYSTPDSVLDDALELSEQYSLFADPAAGQQLLSSSSIARTADELARTGAQFCRDRNSRSARPPSPPTLQSADTKTGNAMSSSGGAAGDGAIADPTALLSTQMAHELGIGDNVSFNTLFSIPDDVAASLDQEMHHSLFGDAGLGMDLSSSLMTSAGPGGDTIADISCTQLFRDVQTPAHTADLHLDGISAASGEDLLACLEEQADQVAPLTQSVSCPVSPAPTAPARAQSHFLQQQITGKQTKRPLKPREKTRQLPPSQAKLIKPRVSAQLKPGRAIVQPTVKTAKPGVSLLKPLKAGQSLLKPRVAADLKKLAQGRGVVSAPNSGAATPSGSRPHTPDGGSRQPPAVPIRPSGSRAHTPDGGSRQAPPAAVQPSGSRPHTPDGGSRQLPAAPIRPSGSRPHTANGEVRQPPAAAVRPSGSRPHTPNGVSRQPPPAPARPSGSRPHTLNGEARQPPPAPVRPPVQKRSWHPQSPDAGKPQQMVGVKTAVQRTQSRPQTPDGGRAQSLAKCGTDVQSSGGGQRDATVLLSPLQSVGQRTPDGTVRIQAVTQQKGVPTVTLKNGTKLKVSVVRKPGSRPLTPTAVVQQPASAQQRNSRPATPSENVQKRHSSRPTTPVEAPQQCRNGRPDPSMEFIKLGSRSHTPMEISLRQSKAVQKPLLKSQSQAEGTRLRAGSKTLSGSRPATPADPQRSGSRPATPTDGVRPRASSLSLPASRPQTAAESRPGRPQRSLSRPCTPTESGRPAPLRRSISRPETPLEAGKLQPKPTQKQSGLQKLQKQPVIISPFSEQLPVIKSSAQRAKRPPPAVVVRKRRPSPDAASQRPASPRPDDSLVARARPGRPEQRQASEKSRHRERRAEKRGVQEREPAAPAVGSVSGRSTCSEEDSVVDVETIDFQMEEVDQLRTQCELLVKHVRHASQSQSACNGAGAGDGTQMPEADIAIDMCEISEPTTSTSVSINPSPLPPQLLDHSYCSRGSSRVSSPRDVDGASNSTPTPPPTAPETDPALLCKVPGYLAGVGDNVTNGDAGDEIEEGEVEEDKEPLLLKVPDYVTREAPPQRKKLSLTEYRQRRSALHSRTGSPRGGSAAASPVPPASSATPPPAPAAGVPVNMPTVPPPAPVLIRRAPHALLPPLPPDAATELHTELQTWSVIPAVGPQPADAPASTEPSAQDLLHVPASPVGTPPQDGDTVVTERVPPPPAGSPPRHAAQPERPRPSSPPRGYRLDAPTKRGRKIHRAGIRARAVSGSDSDSSSSCGSSCSGCSRSSSCSSCSGPEDGSPNRRRRRTRYQSPEDPFRYRPGDFANVSLPSRQRSPAARRRSRSGFSSRSRSRSRSRSSRSRSPRSRRSRSSTRTPSPLAAAAARRRRAGLQLSPRGRRRSPLPAPPRARRSRVSSAERRRREQRDRQREAERERRRQLMEQEEQRDAVDRRVVYVNGLAPNITRERLRDMFGGHGPITRIRIKEREPGCSLYREQADGCYAFLTFNSNAEAVAAQQSGSQRFPHLEVKFGGRREFCLDQYNDQDAGLNNPAYYGLGGGGGGGPLPPPGVGGDLDFDTLLKMEMQRVRKKR